jgi:hypothetical protein
MTLDEITEIFNKTEVTSYAGSLFYTFYTFEDNKGSGRGATVVDARQVDSLVETLAGYEFHSYAENQVPMFIKRAVIEGN